MTDRATLTASYLDEVARHGVTSSDLLKVMPTTGMLAAGGRYLSRPLFIGQGEGERLNADLQHVRAALVSLPDRLYGGDLTAFGTAAGMTAAQISAVQRSQTGNVTQLARADLYSGASGLRLLEFNIGSTVDGIEAGNICQAMLQHPLLAEFAREHQLSYADTLGKHLSLILGETGFAPGSFPMMAVVDWPDHFFRIRPFLHAMTRHWRTLGLDAHACHIGQLKTGGGRVTLRGRTVDIIFRIFLAEHLLEPGGPALMDPVLDAVARGDVAMFSPLDGQLFASKMALAMLSDHANRHLFTPAEQAAIDRVLPWTRMVRPGPVTLEDGRTVDLLDYAASHPGDLVLKPALRHGGIGVVPGWDPGISAELWRGQLAKAADGPYVIQRRVRPVPELFPGEDGEPVPWIVVWGVFTFAAGYGGVFARAFPESTGLTVTRTGSGLSIGCCLVEDPEAARRAAGRSTRTPLT
jgi:hypothetical protein